MQKVRDNRAQGHDFLPQRSDMHVEECLRAQGFNGADAGHIQTEQRINVIWQAGKCI